jgi:AraC-like DNA-binding protein
MSMSVRTLKNRLREEGAVFRDLLEDAREQLAKGYLKESYSVEEISYILGYAETSVFSKAFKKWSGKSPSKYRDMLYSEERA